MDGKTNSKDGLRALALLKATCYGEPNNLSIMHMDVDWSNASFSTVGRDIETVQRFY